MKRINILVILFIAVFFTGITCVKAGSAEESNAKSALEKENSKATVGKYCHYTTTGLKRSDGKSDVIVALSDDYKYAGVDIKGRGGKEDLKKFLPGNDCPAAVMEKRVMLNLLLFELNYEVEVYAIYNLDGALLNFSEEDDTMYYLTDGIENSDVKMTCAYSYVSRVRTSRVNINLTTDLKFTFDNNNRVIKINDDSNFNFDSFQSKYKASFAPDFFFGALAIGDVCPSLYVCNHHDVDENTRIYLSDYQNSANSEACEVIYCTNTDDEKCKPGSEDTRVCAGFSYYTSVDEKVRYCESVLKHTNFVDTCAQKCVDYLNTHRSETYKNAPVGECGFSTRIVVWVENILRWVKYIVPVLIIILSILDFVKAIAAEKEDDFKKAQKRFVVRLIVAALIFIAPLIIEFVLNKLGFDASSCGIGNLGLEK